MKVLITGSTAQHVNPESHRRSRTFAGLLSDYLKKVHGADVEQRGVSVLDDASAYDQYDLVFVGVSPIQALGSNRAYCALAAIGALWDHRKLVLMVDQPDPNLITRGLHSVYGNHEFLTKKFFSYRYEYPEVVEHFDVRSMLLDTVRKMFVDEWPTTLVPALPWTDVKGIESKLPDGAAGKLVPANFDMVLANEVMDACSGNPPIERLDRWVFEKNTDYKWLQSLHLGFETAELPANHRIEVESVVRNELREATGLLAGLTKGDAWWTPRIATALTLGTPVVTDWKHASALGSSWAMLPSSTERLTADERAELAVDQHDAYFDAIDNMTEFDELVAEIVAADSTKNRRTK